MLMLFIQLLFNYLYYVFEIICFAVVLVKYTAHRAGIRFLILNESKID